MSPRPSAKSRRPPPESKPSPVGQRRALGWPWGIVVILLTIYYLLGYTASRQKSTTFDEVAHLTAGHSYWSRGDFRLQPENGWLPQSWLAWPNVGRANFPSVDRADVSGAWLHSSAFAVGDVYFHASGNDPDVLLRRSRAMIGLLAVALGVTVFVWSRGLFGDHGGLISLVLFAACPTLLAHGFLATSDLAAALGFLWAVGAWGRLLRRVTLLRIVVAGAALSWLLLSKFSGVLFAPMAVLLAAWRVMDGSPLPLSWGWPGRSKTAPSGQPHSDARRMITSRGTQAAVLLFAGCAVAVLAWGAIWLAYQGRYSMFASTAGGPQPIMAWEEVLAGSGSLGGPIRQARDRRVLPEAFLYGFAYTLKHAQARPAFFLGEYGARGWTMFFPYCLWAKTPLTLFAAVGLAVVGAWVRGHTNASLATDERRRWRIPAAAPLWVLLGVYWYFALTSSLNIGQRHLLPTYPVMFILAGAAGRWLTTAQDASNEELAALGITPARVRHLRLATAAVLVLALVEAARVWPHYLAYFQPLTGGSSTGYRQLVDSSVDWGQDLPALRDWLKSTAPQEPVFLSYFGTGNPQHYDIDAQRLPGFFDKRPPGAPPLDLRPGVYAISATMLQGVYLQCPGAWNPSYEVDYQQGLALLQQLQQAAPAEREALLLRHGQRAGQLLSRWDHLRFGRLCHFLRQREPDGFAGYSILIYRLTAEDLGRAQFGPL